MNPLFVALLLFACSNCQADEITCFSGKTRIYHGFAHHFEYDDQTVSFHDNKTDHKITVNGDCIIELYPPSN